MTVSEKKAILIDYCKKNKLRKLRVTGNWSLEALYSVFLFGD